MNHTGQQVLSEESPIPKDMHFSDEFRDFIRLCMHKDPFKRPPAEQLLMHPFVSMVRVHENIETAEDA